MAAPLVIAHRGASGHRPENTLPAYELAIEQRADMIEIDLHRTRDGAIVVAHDAELAGLGGKGEIGGSTLAEIRSLDAGGGARVPTLEEVLDGFAARIPFNLEIKRATDTDYESIETATVGALAERGLLDGMLFSSFYDTVLARLRECSTEARIGVLCSPRQRGSAERLVERAVRVGAEAVHPHFAQVDEALVVRAHEAGLVVYTYTVDEEDRMQTLIDLGVDGIFTNLPDRMRALIDRARPPRGR